MPRSARDHSGIHWPTAVNVAGVIFLLACASQFPVPLLPDMVRDLNLPLTYLGVFFTAHAAGRLVADLPAGRFIDSRGLRTALPISAVFMTIGIVLLVQSRTTFQLLAAGALTGVGTATANTSGMAYFSTAAPQRQRGLSMSIYAGGLLGGVAIGPALGGWLSVGLGWRGSLGAAAVIAGAATVIAFRSRNRISAAAVAVAARISDHNPIGRPRLLSRVALWSVIFSVSYSISGMIQTIVPITASGTLRLSTAALGTILGVGGLARMSGTLAAGILADRISRKSIVVPALVLQGASVVVLAIYPSLSGFVTSVVATSAFSVGVALAAAMLGDLTATDRIGRELGQFRFIGDFGLVAGPAISTLLIEAGHSDFATFLVAILLLVSAALVGWGVPETNRRQAPAEP